MERKVGGRAGVLLWTSTLDLEWNDMPVKPVFLPFVHTVDEIPGGFHRSARIIDGRARSSRRRGGRPDAAGIRRGGGRSGTIAVAPSGARVSVETEDGALELEEQGFYDVRVQGAAADSATTLAANVDLSESDLSPLDPRELAAAVAGRAPGEIGRAGQRAAERRRAGTGAAALVVSARGGRTAARGRDAPLQSSFAERMRGFHDAASRTVSRNWSPSSTTSAAAGG